MANRQKKNRTFVRKQTFVPPEVFEEIERCRKQRIEPSRSKFCRQLIQNGIQAGSTSNSKHLFDKHTGRKIEIPMEREMFARIREQAVKSDKTDEQICFQFLQTGLEVHQKSSDDKFQPER